MILELFSRILSYPNQELKKNTVALIKQIEGIPESRKELFSATDYLKVFYYYLEKTNLKEQEEVYTQTFEVQSITTLDTGYILFGDDYKRAELLVNLNNELNKYHIDPEHELADFLPNILKLLDKLQEQEIKQDIIMHVTYPAIKKMINEFDNKIIDKKNEVYLKHQKTLIEKSQEFKDIYINPLLALKIILECLFNAHDIIETDKSNGFLSNIKQELDIEKI